MRWYLRVNAELVELDSSSDEHDSRYWDAEMVFDDLVTITGDEKIATDVWEYLLEMSVPDLRARP